MPSAIEKWALQFHIKVFLNVLQLHARIFKIFAAKFVGHHIATKNG
jgi:hypothetical protein